MDKCYSTEGMVGSVRAIQHMGLAGEDEAGVSCEHGGHVSKLKQPCSGGACCCTPSVKPQG
jgi:hypothetical protein